jgi:tRNA dimethylallyltransferase
MPTTPAPPVPDAVPLLIITGPTASGKSTLALEVAERIDGEIVSADAFAVYRGMDIGTDKPTSRARARVPHHVLDVVPPTDRMTAGDFVRMADRAIADIRTRNHVPIVVGGTNFWIRALLVGLFPAPPSDPAIRARLERHWEADAAMVVERLRNIDPNSAERIGSRDRQRVLRALEVFELTGRTMSEHIEAHPPRLRYRPALHAPDRDRSDLYARIDLRVDSMFDAGFVREVERLLEQAVPPDAHALKAIGYREVVGHLLGHQSLDDAVAATKRSSRAYAKRQLTWLRTMREARVAWVPPADRSGADAIIGSWARHNEGTVTT